MTEVRNPVRAFGPRASDWAHRLPPSLSAIVADPADAANALAAGAELRLAGKPYYTAILIDDRRASVAAALAPAILSQTSSLEERISRFDHLAVEALPISGLEQRNLVTVDAPAAQTLRYLFALADNVLVRSWTEYNALSQLFTGFRHHLEVYAPADPSVPAPASPHEDRDAIVIWGPHVTSASLALLCFALEELHSQVIVVSSDGVEIPLRAQFVHANDGAAALARATVVVDASLGDPGTSIALCRYGVPVVTASTSGAHEYLSPHYVYEPWAWRSVRNVVSKALGGRASSVRSSAAAHVPPALAAPAPFEEGPLVSIVIPTYNRRNRLRDSLPRWGTQLYKNIELVMVNDGGESVDDIAAAHPFVRVVNLETNQGIPKAVNAGAHAAQGKYLLVAADDDSFAPDHILNIVQALERTGGGIGHSNVIIQHEEMLRDGTHRIYGYSLDWNNTMDPSRVLATAVVAITGVIFTREAFFSGGEWDETLPTMRDYQMIVNVAKDYDFVHVDTTSAVYSSRPDPSSAGYRHQEQIADALRTIYARNPVEGRPSIEQWRQMEIAHYEGRKDTALFEPPMRLYPKE